MSNRQDFEEASKLANSLLESTQNGKVEWFLYDQDVFTYATPTGITFFVSVSPEGIFFKMRDSDDHDLISVATRSNKEYWELEEGEQGISQVLPQLYDAARRSALRVEAKVSEISEYLNSL